MLQILRKTYKALLIIGSMFLPMCANAAEITAIDFNGNIIGQVISTGMVISPDGENIGTITADSLILNGSGAVIGGVVPQGIAIGMDNRLLGKIHSDGIVRSLSGRTVGTALPNGLVIDSSAEVIGAVLYPGIIYSSAGEAIGRLTGGGEYTKLEGQRVGFVSANGYAYRKSGDDYVLDGRLMSSKMVISVEGKFLGSIAPTGQIIDFEGKPVGKIHANGFAYNENGKIIGSVVATAYAFDQAGKYLGVVGYNGEVKQGEQVVAMYRADGNLVRPNGDVVGFAVDIAATANDNNGNYLGYVVPQGNIVRGKEIVGKIGAKGIIYDAKGNKIGELVKTGPVYDALARLKGQSMKNGRFVTLGGNVVGHIRGKYAFDSNGTLTGGVSEGMIAIDNTNKSLGMSNIDSGVARGSNTAKISPFGYLFGNDGKVIGAGYPMSAVYGNNGVLYSYINPNGELYRQATDVTLSEAGVAYSKNGYLGEMVNPLYALDFIGNPLGQFANGNIVLNAGKIAYKILPDGYAVETSEALSPMLTPIKGFGGNRRIALNIGGDLIGYASETGEIDGLNGNTFGRIMYNEYIADNKKSVVGKLIPFATVVNEKCSVIGVVNGRGDIVNNRDVIIGRLLPNGQAISDVGSYIGYAVFEQVLIDNDGNFAGTVHDAQGNDMNSKNIGCVNRKGIIEDDEHRQRYGVITAAPTIDFENNLFGYVLANGQVVSRNDQILGYMQPNGNVVSKSKKVLGNVMRYQVAYTDNNRFLGMIGANGEVISEKGELAGQVNFDGSIVKDGEVIGYALYDFYVYDENFVTYGYLTKDGTVLSMVGSRLGQIDRGFVVDRNGQIIARGNRDYIVRDINRNAVGELRIDGTVVDFEGQNVGYLSEGGVIRDPNGDEIAQATPYQYYVAIQKAGEVSEKIEPKDRRKVKINEAEKTEDVAATEKKVRRQKLGNRVVGIALSPDGDIIGNIYDDDTVRTDDGTQVGYRTPDGMIVDMNYNPIGIEEAKHSTATEMFIPPDAYGDGRQYGTKDAPTNLGAGGGYGQGERYDPIRAKALQQLQNRRRMNMMVGELANSNPDYNPAVFTGYEEDGWDNVSQNISSWRVDMSEMILQDKGIPAVLARSVYASEGLSSDIPITAIVERNVFAEEGRNIIIPAGSRVIGKVSGTGTGGNSGGAVKIDISWSRLIRPDGSQWILSNAQTADAQGRAGAIGYLDEQLLKKYSVPLMNTVLQGLVNIATAGGGESTTTTNSDGSKTTTTDARAQAYQDARKAFNDRVGDMIQEIMDKKAQIKSVVYVPAGTRIIIYPNEDLWLNSIKRDAKRRANGGSGAGGEADTLSNGEMGQGGEVTYEGNYRENVQPARAPSNPQPVSNGGQQPVGYVAPPSTQPAPSMNSNGSNGDVPELL
ncbi:MAG: TrbI/VirB10 family protein [Alphaproteobacteria bacterium]|nr:TrbI/VirB10 family protein [Alphaproteobacteria bacterium]